MKILSENLSVKKTESGISLFFIRKKDYYTKHGLIGVNFGSIYNKINAGGQNFEFPFGIAHFLEHKLFDDKKINYMNEFIKLGADVNAFTNSTNTAYYFNTGENFYKSLDLLIKMTSETYLTDESVENEKKVIEQEINMYSDYPAWNAYLNMMKNMYYNESFSKNIAGEVEDIKKINRKDLELCFDKFYIPENICIICVGDFDEDKAIAQIEESIVNTRYGDKKKSELCNPIFEEEKSNVKSDYVESKLSVANNIFVLGFKDNEKYNIKNIAASKILIDIMFGESSVFYNQMYAKGLIDNTFNGDYNNFKFFANSVLGGISKNPKELCKYILEQINNTKQSGIDQKRFEQIKKKHLGLFIRGFNNLESISNLTLDLFSKNGDFEELLNDYENIDIDYLNSRLSKSYLDDNYVLSVVKPQ